MKGRIEAEALLRQVEALGVRLYIESDALRVSAPKGVLDVGLRADLAANKSALLALLAERTLGTLRRASREGRLPVSAAQQRLWFLDQVNPGSAAYGIPGALRVRGVLDRGALQGALQDVVTRHEALRTRIAERDGAPWVEVCDEASSQIEFIDLAGKPHDEAEATVEQLSGEVSRTAFDMAQGPLSKIVVMRLADDHHYIVISMHHIISDGWSMRVMINEILQFYNARVEGRQSPLVPLEFSLVDHAAWERSEVESGRFAQSLAHWKQVLHDAPPVLELPFDRPRPQTSRFYGARISRFVDLGLIERVKARAQQQGATTFMALMACWQAVLHRYSGQDDVVVGTPLANRDRSEFEGLIGCLINNIVVRGRFAGDLTLSGFLDQIRGQALHAFDHGRVPFDLVVEYLNPARSTSHAPIFQVLFTYMSFPVSMPQIAGLTLEPIVLDSHTSRFDLTCEMSVDPFGEHANMQRVNYEYSRELFDERFVESLHDHFEQMLVAFAADPSQRIDDVPLALSATDREILSATAPRVDHDRSLCAHQLLEASAAAAPDRPALTVGDDTLGFGALDRRANRLAHLLIARGVTRGDLVAFCLDRTADIPVTMAAVLKIGAAYVPLDPTHPRDRLRYVVEDSEARCIVTLRGFAPLFDAAGAQLLVLDEEGDALAGLRDDPPGVAVSPDDLAYVIYTSGSTGRPKGVEVEHRNLVAFLDAMAREPGLEADDVLLAVTTPSFDISGLEIWLPLMRGARIVMASRADVIDGARLAELIRSNCVTVLQATPATWRLLLDTGWTGKADLKALCGGEAMPRDLASRLQGRVGELWNMYGPTETTIWSTVCRVADAAGPIPIGHAIANTSVRVLDANGRHTPIGVVGELCIGGEGVARGYRKRPELTAEKFVVLDPFGTGPERVYRTGDLARFKGDGQLEFIGRRDHQVKVRGYRIELGEIEALLAAFRGVRECAVIVREDTPGDQRLTAYVTVAAEQTFDPEAARTALRESLPDYMTPAAFVVLEALPLTPNGKIDRAALPRPVIAKSAASDRASDLMNPVQRRVAQIWSEVLNVEQIRLNDNFFDIGGHSLLLVKLHAQLKAAFGIELQLVELFQRTTVAAQAERVTTSVQPNDALERARARAERIARA